MHPEIDTEKIQWHKPSHESDYTWSYVERWLDDFGVSFPAADAYAVAPLCRRPTPLFRKPGKERV